MSYLSHRWNGGPSAAQLGPTRCAGPSAQLQYHGYSVERARGQEWPRYRKFTKRYTCECCKFNVVVELHAPNRIIFRATKCTTPQILIWPCPVGSPNSSTTTSSPPYPISHHTPSIPSGWRRTRQSALARPLPRFRYVF